MVASRHVCLVERVTDDLAGLRIVSFEARRADELATMLARQGADVVRAPALREAPLGASAEALELARRLEARELAAVVLLTGVGTRQLAAVVPGLPALLADVAIVARGPKPLAALRELGVAGAHAVPEPFTWREVVPVVERLRLPPGALVAVQEYGAPVPRLVDALGQRGLRVLRVPVYRWALPHDAGPLRTAAEALGRGDIDVAVFTNSAQVEHLFRVAADPAALRVGLARVAVASVGPVCTEALEAHDVGVDLEASPPKMGPLVALVARRARAVRDGKRGAA
jgi:uroporphyrinogen-III synthase